MEIFIEAGMDRIRERSLSLPVFLEFFLGRHSSPIFSIISPREPEPRGAQLSLRILRHGQSLCERLAAQGVVADWRQPDILRVAPVPLYNSYLDVYRFVRRFTHSLSYLIIDKLVAS